MPLITSRPCAVLDTDTYNEVDDQFALAHLLLSPEQVDLEAIYAAPFSNHRSSAPGDGMEKSFHEIHRLLDLVDEARPPVFRGSTTYLPDARTPVDSEAVRDLVTRAMAPREGKLHVLAIGACTNVASALLLEPKIAERIVIVWLGGHAPYWDTANEFNLMQDPHASRILLEAHAPLVLVPCVPVASHLIVTVPELEAQLAPFSKLGADLTAIVRSYGNNAPAWSKVIWDIAVTAWLLIPNVAKTTEEPSPLLEHDLTWSHPPSRPKISVIHSLKRDAIFADFYAKARAHGEKLNTQAGPRE